MCVECAITMMIWSIFFSDLVVPNVVHLHFSICAPHLPVEGECSPRRRRGHWRHCLCFTALNKKTATLCCHFRISGALQHTHPQPDTIQKSCNSDLSNIDHEIPLKGEFKVSLCEKIGQIWNTHSQDHLKKSFCFSFPSGKFSECINFLKSNFSNETSRSC